MKSLTDLVRQIIRRYPLSCLLTVAIWVVCMIPIPETPLSDVSMIDKWTHIVMFMTQSLMMSFEFAKNKKKTAPAVFVWRKDCIRFLLTYAWIVPTAMGGMIELAQAYLTNGVRNGDFIDFVADGLGAVLAVVIGILLVVTRAKA